MAGKEICWNYLQTPGKELLRGFIDCVLLWTCVIFIGRLDTDESLCSGTHQSYSHSQIALALQASVFVVNVFGDISLICWISQHFLAVVSAHFNNKIYWHCSLWKWAACHGSCLWHMTLEFTQPSQISCFDLYITVSIANLLLSVVKKCLYAVWTNCVLYLCQWNHCQASGVESCIFYRWFWISAVRWVQVGTF